jgi:alpha-ribazole phosphatase
MAAALTRQTGLWLIRHPEPESSAAGRCYGSLDLDLSETGISQAHAAAAFLAEVPLSAIYSSPLRRCTQAAAIIAASRMPFSIVDALRELDFGELEGRTYEEIASLYPELYRQWMESPTEVCFPGGESFSQMQARVIQARDELLLRHAGESIALITHGGNIRILLSEALGVPARYLFRIGQSYSGISRIRYVEDVPVVDFVNIETERLPAFGLSASWRR